MEIPKTQEQDINMSICRIREKQKGGIRESIASSTAYKDLGIFFITIDGPYQEHVLELVNYLRFGLWWLALGVASSIGLGSGLHTFVMYLGPHIALFTIKAVKCGRVDIKSSLYDTIQLHGGPSWLDRNCTAFGPPMYSSLQGSRIPLTSILAQIQLEAILWGVGTALGELPPYFISRAASMSGSKLEVMKEFESSEEEDNTIMATQMKQIKNWLLSHLQYMNFFTILVLASVPNPLFDLAGILCGQFGIPFWKFFLATLIGKAIIKTHIQTAFIISFCQNSLQNYKLLETNIWHLHYTYSFKRCGGKMGLLICFNMEHGEGASIERKPKLWKLAAAEARQMF
ncbi:hypothetical protein OIU78_021244 [Salix suchowensis]|nr:hypothetical protein OIU78_021244 [Salix suchowensis]